MSKSSKTNIVLVNLNQQQLLKVMQFCTEEKIYTTFSNNYYPCEYYEVNYILDDMLKNNEKIPKELHSALEDYLEMQQDDEELNKNKIEQIKKILNISN